MSVVVPLFEEEDNVFPLFDKIDQSLQNLELRYELIFVDDGSRDGTMCQLIRLQESAKHVRVIRFRKNFGQTAAMRAGIDAARAPIIITMDGDLQNDPADIPLLLEKLDAGNDLVIGWRRDRQDAFSRTVLSRVANRLIGWITGIRVHDSGCSLKAYRQSMISRVPLYSEMHRFIPAMSTVAGARIAEVVVRHHAREQGRSKYGLSRIGRVLLDVIAIKMLITFGRRPLHWFCALSLPFLCGAVLAAITYVLVRSTEMPGQDSVVPPIAFMLMSYLFVHFLFLGLLAELAIRAFQSPPHFHRGTVEHYAGSAD